MKTQTVIRRARNAIGLVIDGAMRHIESNESHIADDYRTLFDAIHSELLDWESPGEVLSQQSLVNDMHALMDSTSPAAVEFAAAANIDVATVRALVTALLSRSELLP